MLSQKYDADRRRVTELILKKTDGCKEKIKVYLLYMYQQKLCSTKDFNIFLQKIRWLFVSAQTFGMIDGVCIPAELGLSEFDFTDGILDVVSRNHNVDWNTKIMSKISKYIFSSPLLWDHGKREMRCSAAEQFFMQTKRTESDQKLHLELEKLRYIRNLANI